MRVGTPKKEGDCDSLEIEHFSIVFSVNKF